MEQNRLNDNEFEVFDVIATCIIEELTEIINWHRQTRKSNGDKPKKLFKMLINARNKNQLDAYDNVYKISDSIDEKYLQNVKRSTHLISKVVMGVIDEAESSINKLNYLKNGNASYESKDAETLAKLEVKKECRQIDENEGKINDLSKALLATKPPILFKNKHKNEFFSKKSFRKTKGFYVPFSLRNKKLKAQNSSPKAARTFRCNKCGFRAPSSSCLRKHYKHHTEPQKDYVYKCCHCNYSTGSKAYYEYHKTLHESKEDVKQEF